MPICPYVLIKNRNLGSVKVKSPTKRILTTFYKNSICFQIKPELAQTKLTNASYDEHFMIYLIFLAILLILGFIVAIHLSFKAPRLSNNVLPIDYDLDAQTYTFAGQQGSQLSIWWINALQPCATTVVI